MISKYINKYKNELKNSINDLKHKDTFYKQVPNLLTFMRLVGGIPAGLMYYLGNPTIALVLIAALWGTDAIDGKIARKYNIQSQLGADMDAFADKIMFLASSLPLLANAPGLIINFALEGVISAINVTGRVKGLDTKTVLSGKIKTVSLVLTLIAGYLTQFFGMPSLIFRLLKGFTTGFQFIAIKDYISEFLRMNKELKNKQNVNDSEEKEVLNEKDENDSLEKTLTPSVSKVEELKNLRELILGSQKPDKDRTKRRTRKINGKNEEKNNN